MRFVPGMRARLVFALTLAVDFDCFLIDEVISVGDQRFHAKCHDALFVKRDHCAMIWQVMTRVLSKNIAIKL